MQYMRLVYRCSITWFDFYFILFVLFCVWSHPSTFLWYRFTHTLAKYGKKLSKNRLNRARIAADFFLTHEVAEKEINFRMRYTKGEMIFSVFSWFNSLYIFFLGNSSEILPFYHHSRTYGTETRLVYFGFCFVKPCVSLTRHAFLLWLRYQEFGITCLHFSVSVLFLAMAVLSCVG